jgi:hypothetical protein
LVGAAGPKRAGARGKPDIDLITRAERTPFRIAEYSTAQVALLGCTNCGLVVEGTTTLGVGHLTSDACFDCDTPLRVIDLAEANQLTRERFLAAHWREIATSKNKERSSTTKT